MPLLTQQVPSAVLRSAFTCLTYTLAHHLLSLLFLNFMMANTYWIVAGFSCKYESGFDLVHIKVFQIRFINSLGE